MERPKKYFFVISVAILFLEINRFIFRERIFLPIGDFLIIQDEPQPGDAIHVIAGLDHRTDYAIQLYKLGVGKRILFAGEWRPIQNPYYGDYSQKRELDQGAPLEALVTDDSQVTSIYSEIVRLKKLIEKFPKPIHSIIAVGDPHHMRRVRWAYRQVLGKSFSLTMAPVPFDLSPYRTRWWTKGKSKGMVEEEYLKLAYYITRYQLSWGFLEKWLASFDRD